MIRPREARRPLDHGLSFRSTELSPCSQAESDDKMKSMARHSILIVDTDHELAQIIASFLNFQGYRVNYTSRQREAIGKLSLQKYSCILLDPDLQGEKGEEVIRAAGDPAGMNGRTPFILTTFSLEYGLPYDVVSPIRCILPKPFTLEQLLGVLKQAIPR